MTTGPVVAEADYQLKGDQVAPGFPLLLEVGWSAPCGKGGRCKRQPFAVEVDCGAVPCEVARLCAPDEGEEVSPLLSRQGWMQLEVRPGGTGRFSVELTLTQLETGERKQVSLRPLVVAQPTELGFACRYDDTWQPCTDTARHGEYFELAVWAKTAAGSYLAVQPQVSFQGESWDAVEITCWQYPDVSENSFASDPYLCSGAYGIPGQLIIEADYQGLSATQLIDVQP